jgi:acylphosphatase
MFIYGGVHMGDNKVRKHIYISGRVQGVGFRANARQKAQSIGVKGWIKNLFDGRVEAVVEGDKETVSQMMKFLKRGPSFANVTDVEIENENYSGDFNNFSIKY